MKKSFLLLLLISYGTLSWCQQPQPTPSGTPTASATPHLEEDHHHDGEEHHDENEQYEEHDHEGHNHGEHGDLHASNQNIPAVQNWLMRNRKEQKAGNTLGSILQKTYPPLVMIVVLLPFYWRAVRR